MSFDKDEQRVGLDGAPRAGAPLGLMGSLAMGLLWETKEEHEASLPFLIHEERAKERAEILMEPEGANLASCERKPRDGEGLEPEDVA